MLLYSGKLNTEMYRSGRNENDSKTLSFLGHSNTKKSWFNADFRVSYFLEFYHFSPVLLSKFFRELTNAVYIYHYCSPVFTKLNTEAYRSGHNGPDSKSGIPPGIVGSNPTASAKICGHLFWYNAYRGCPLSFLNPWFTRDFRCDLIKSVLTMAWNY